MKIKFIKHGECSEELLHIVASLKMQHWDYPIAEHIRWFNTNLFTDDVHLCVFEAEILVAYATISHIQYELEDGMSQNALGIGSVCVDKNHLNKQYGFLVIQLATFYIRQQKAMGLLICKDELVPFYEKTNWQKFNGEILIANSDRICNLLSTVRMSSSKISLSNSF